MNNAITFDSLRQKKSELVKTFTIDTSLGTFTAAKLNLLEKMTALQLIDSLDKNEEGRPTNTRKNVQRFVEIVCMSLCDPNGEKTFANEEGRALIAGLDDDDFKLVSETIMEKSGLTRSSDDAGNEVDTPDGELEDAKND